MVQAVEPVANPFDDLALDRLRRRTSAKWRMYPEDVLPLWVAEMDAVVAPPIVEAVHEALLMGDTGYPAGHAYAEAMAGFGADCWGWAFDPVTTAKVTDVLTGVMEIIRITSLDGGAIVVTPPVYPPFYMIAKTLDRPVFEAPLTGDYRLDPETLERAFVEATRGGRSATLILSNPHNPTGTVHTREELEQVARLARQYSVRVIADEIHAPLQMPTSTFVPYLAAAGTERDFSVMSASKGWNLAGFKAALVIPGSEGRDVIAAMAGRAGSHPGHIGLIAHTAAITHACAWLDAAIVGIDRNRMALTGMLAEHLPGTVYTPPESTYLAWVDCRPLGLGDDPAAAFLERGRVALSSGVPFGPGGAGHVRVNLATSPAVLLEAVQRMASVVAVVAAD